MSTKVIAEKKREYIFGPVPSRRLGRSLGVDLVPFKTCSYDCIYCQLGRTTNKTIQRKEWVPIDIVIDQLKKKLDSKPDYITLSGSGEPTLFSRLEDLISRIKDITDIPVAVLTNGSLLWLPEVRNALKSADMVVPSLDAGSSQIFQYVNRPHSDITFSKMLQGLVEFRKDYNGQYWLEVFLLAGVTTTEMEINKLKTCIATIEPDLVQVNTVTRPPAEDFAERVPEKQLKTLAAQLYEKAEVIADYNNVHKQQDFSARREDVLTLLQRRPCSIGDIAAGLGLHRNEVVKYVEELSLEGKIEAKPQNQQLYYKVVVP
jgi:wyosine [tRNA(Phe)-imidazoG37] synthetase (radical SAM superfamily)